MPAERVNTAVRAWQVTRYGGPSEALALTTIAPPRPGPGEILVRTSASACNYNEIDGCYGRYLTVNPSLPYTLGMEFVGKVTDSGAGAEAWIGRRVMGAGTGAIGAHAEQVVGPSTMAFDVPPELSDTEAAAFFFPFHLAHLGLHERGQLTKGETVLIHAAVGGVGSAAVQLAVAAGARVIATAGSPSKLEIARSLGADVAIDYSAGGFAAAVLDATDGRGVDICFDGVGGGVTNESLRCLARNGRHLVVGFASGIEAEEVPTVTGRTLCFGNFSLVGVVLSYQDPTLAPAGLGYNPMPPEVGIQVHAHLVELLRAGQIRPVIGKVVPFAELPGALEEMEARRTVGRTVVTWR